MSIYEEPKLTVYGPVQSLTGRLGGANERDFAYGQGGPDDILADGTGSQDTCEKPIDGVDCL